MKILIVAEIGLVDLLEPTLSVHDVEISRGRKSLLKTIRKKSYDVLLLDGDKSAMSEIKSSDPRLEIILIGKDHSEAVEAIRLGASAYFAMPVDAIKIKEKINEIEKILKLRRDTAELEGMLNEKYRFRGIIGKNPQMLEIYSYIRRIAPHFKSVLITGETGVGKEVIAETLHSMSPVAENQFLTCNCGGIVEGLIESELFGYKKGAFSGAASDKKGLFEAAGEGIILLDEIGEMPLASQTHLLRVLESGEFRPVGGTDTLKSRCRIIAATNKDLSAEVKAGRFREDLYYRLTSFVIYVPPLRERMDDIPLLCKSFLTNFSKRSGKTIKGISMPAQKALMSYLWPGNVRELKNVVEHAAVMAAENFLGLEDLPPLLKEQSIERHDEVALLDDVVKRHIFDILSRCEGNRSEAARALGISRWALLRKLEKYNIQ